MTNEEKKALDIIENSPASRKWVDLLELINHSQDEQELKFLLSIPFIKGRQGLTQDVYARISYIQRHAND